MTQKSFKAKLEAGGHLGAWVRIHMPFDVEKAFGAKGRVSVIAELNGARFNTSIFPDGDGRHHMLVNKEMQRAACAGVGDTIAVVMRADDGTGAVALPEALNAALGKDKTAKKTFDALTPAARREYAAWVGGAKQEATRTERAAKALTMLRAGVKRPSAR